MTAEEMAKKLGWKKITGTGKRQVGDCYIGDMLSRVMGSSAAGSVWITVQSSVNMAAVAEFTQAACVLLPENVTLSPEVAERAGREDISVYSTEQTAFRAALSIGALL